MSTFDGIVKEFPDIRIDYFRNGNQASRPPLAYFLSHVHSDHLQGLETCKSPFIYCSPATRDILLQMERYPHRMNFAKGILESRKQTYRHLGKLLKTIHLETQTVIDLAPKRSIRVTLFDANHCVGAVMFLIEDGSNAVLYTGDIRSELWWVNALTRHPLLLPYVCRPGQKPLRKLDCIYLDTTFANKSNPYRDFAPKADGVTELLRKVAKYPKSTVFYFDSWTFGYEDVWLALSAFLGSQVHLDQYRYNLYQALAYGSEPRAEEAARLFGFKCGNHFQQGCLTLQQSRLHSCEQGTGCEVFENDFVRITPIISRYDGVEMAELGARGGQGDLDQQHELKLDDSNTIGHLISLCVSQMQGERKLRDRAIQMLLSVIDDRSPAMALGTAALHAANSDIAELKGLKLEDLVPAFTKMATTMQERKADNAVLLNDGWKEPPASKDGGLPMRITFPYSRHSSYTELCHLIEAFQPSDIYPCTVDRACWDQSHSMSFLFGHLYSPSPVPSFSHDQKMFGAINKSSGLGQRRSTTNGIESSESNVQSCSKPGNARTRSPLAGKFSLMPPPVMPTEPQLHASVTGGPDTQSGWEMDRPVPDLISPRAITKRPRLDNCRVTGSSPPQTTPEMIEADLPTPTPLSRNSWSPEAYSIARREEIERGLAQDEGYRWDGLVSVSGHQEEEVEL